MSFENWRDNVNCSKFVCSWSGGKDSCLALYRATRIGQPVKLFTMLNETGVKSRSHGLSLPFVQLQAEALGLPIEMRSATWDAYEAEFVTALCHFKREGVQAVVFGDIDLEEHGLWEEKVCNAADLKHSLPLWKNDRRELVTEFISLGFKAVIVAINKKMLNSKFLGRVLSMSLLEELEQQGVDLCGENGEFHTAVLDGPIFRRPVTPKFGEVLTHQGYSFLTLTV